MGSNPKDQRPEAIGADLRDMLWIVPGFVDPVLRRLVQGEHALWRLRGMPEGTRAAVAELPLAETDDGRIPDLASA